MAIESKTPIIASLKFNVQLLLASVCMYIGAAFYVGIAQAFIFFYLFYFLFGGCYVFGMVWGKAWSHAKYFILFALGTTILMFFVFPKAQDFQDWLCLGPKTHFPDFLQGLSDPLCHLKSSQVFRD